MFARAAGNHCYYNAPCFKDTYISLVMRGCVRYLQYLERMELLYGAKAREVGCYVVGSCGLDSIPNDMGLVYARQKFEGQLMS